ncbi:FmdB family zinc ribbon protein [Desertihabitans aurantiacus]|uniref:FmdB family zinc ribbon protein n=1 Tax=Desertihabitans aurantiacus TaxID=2282477 RepID=UPI000DF77F49|nr:FmdB family zinc ribbon protein [Desertihabitans aurantiacus]
MPTYQYRCQHCQQELEVVQKFTDSALTVCPHCDGELRKIYNAVGVVFKGSGFYKTDSRAGEKKSSTSDSGSSSSSSGDSGSSSNGSSGNGSTAKTPAGSTSTAS